MYRKTKEWNSLHAEGPTREGGKDATLMAARPQVKQRRENRLADMVRPGAGVLRHVDEDKAPAIALSLPQKDVLDRNGSKPGADHCGSGRQFDNAVDIINSGTGIIAWRLAQKPTNK